MNTVSSLVCNDYISGGGFTLCISTTNTVFSFGKSKYHAHGHKQKQINIPQQIQGLTNIKMISCGYAHSIALDIEGNVYSFGANNYSQLGKNNKLQQTHIPQKVLLPPIKQVSCGSNFTLCVSEDSLLFGFGYNSAGQLGLGNYSTYSSPQQIPDIYDIDYVICGGSHSICKTFTNQYYSWGTNSDGQLGNGTNINAKTPTECLNWPNNIKNIKTGILHSVLLTEEGKIYTFGSNSSSQLGISKDSTKSINFPKKVNKINEIQRVECGDNHTVCIDYENNIWVFGYNYYGQLGLGDQIKRAKVVKHNILKDIIDISSKSFHTLVKTSDNTIYAFGKNNNLQLGIKTKKEYQLTPIKVLEDNSDIWCSFIAKSRAKSARK